MAAPSTPPLAATPALAPPPPHPPPLPSPLLTHRPLPSPAARGPTLANPPHRRRPQPIAPMAATAPPPPAAAPDLATVALPHTNLLATSSSTVPGDLDSATSGDSHTLAAAAGVAPRDQAAGSSKRTQATVVAAPHDLSAALDPVAAIVDAAAFPCAAPLTSSLFPFAIPFHPVGSSVGRPKAHRWAEDNFSGDSDDEASLTASSYLDMVCHTQQTRPVSPQSAQAQPSAAVLGMHGANDVEMGGRVAAADAKRRHRLPKRRRARPQLLLGLPVHNRNVGGGASRRRLPVHQRLDPWAPVGNRRRISALDADGWRKVLPQGPAGGGDGTGPNQPTSRRPLRRIPTGLHDKS